MEMFWMESKEVFHHHTVSASYRIGDLADHAAGITGGKHALRHVPRDYAAGADDGSRSDADAGQDQGAAAHPDVGADLDGLTELLAPPEFRVPWVHRGVDLHRGAEEGEVSHAHFAKV